MIVKVWFLAHTHKNKVKKKKERKKEDTDKATAFFSLYPKP